jgi:hypothetical protein
MRSGVPAVKGVSGGVQLRGLRRDQELLLPPSMREWLAEDHLAWFMLDAVDAIDLGAF